MYNAEYVIAREEKVEAHFVAGAGCPLAGKEFLSVQELLSQPFLLTEKGMSYRRLLDQKLAEMSLELHPVLEIGSTDLLCLLVGQGAGVTFLPDFVTEEEVRSGRLLRISVNDFKIHVWKQLLYHRDKWLSPPMECVLRYCAQREFSSDREEI